MPDPIEEYGPLPPREAEPIIRKLLLEAEETHESFFRQLAEAEAKSASPLEIKALELVRQSTAREAMALEAAHAALAKAREEDSKRGESSRWALDSRL